MTPAPGTTLPPDRASRAAPGGPPPPSSRDTVPDRPPTGRTAAPTRAHAVGLRGYGRTFDGSHAVLAGVDLDLAPGEIVAVLGASGCGKSTLLRAVGGLDAATAGTVEIDGTPVRPYEPRCAVGFQEPRLLPWRDLAANVALGLPRGTPRAAGRQRVAELLGLVGLSGFASHRPRSLSGGMAQRASLARALAREPGVLLLDEPFGALDALTRLSMQDLLLDVLAQRPTTVLLVTHDVDEAVHLADRVVVLGRPDGADASVPATVASTTTVPLARPRRRDDADLARLRTDLLGQLGVHA